MLANTPKPPYYAVIFSSVLSEQPDGYAEMADKILTLAEQQPGFLGFETARDEIGISVSYWQSLDAIKAWRENSDHRLAQQQGNSKWYKSYHIRIARVERDNIKVT